MKKSAGHTVAPDPGRHLGWFSEVQVLPMGTLPPGQTLTYPHTPVASADGDVEAKPPTAQIAATKNAAIRREPGLVPAFAIS
jgi:hypothetical protein